MKKSIVLFCILSICAIRLQSQDKPRYSEQISEYVDFLQQQTNSAVDYIFKLFEKYDMVVICERMHPEYTQYDFFYDIISDKRFIEMGGTIYTEISGAAGTKMFERLTYSDENLDSIIIDSINFDTQFWPSAHNRNFYDFLHKIRNFNSQSPDRRIRWVGADSYLNWNDIRDKNDVDTVWKKAQNDRDRMMAINIYNDFIKNGQKKSLVIMNYRHSFMNDSWSKPAPEGTTLNNTAAFLKHFLKGRAVNVWLNDVNTEGKVLGLSSNMPILNGRMDAAFKVLGNPSIGFDMAGSPLGKVFFEIWPQRYARHALSFQDVFHGFVFYNPVEKHQLVNNFPEYYADPENFDEAVRRYNLIGEHRRDINSVRRIKKALKREKITSESYKSIKKAEKKINRWIKD